MISVDRTLRRRGAPSRGEFVTAVIRVHERVIAGLKALASNTSPVRREAHEDAEIIRSYSALNGVNVGVPDFEEDLAFLDRKGVRRSGAPPRTADIAHHAPLRQAQT